jgi:hypothetical protein
MALVTAVQIGVGIVINLLLLLLLVELRRARRVKNELLDAIRESDTRQREHREAMLARGSAILLRALDQGEAQVVVIKPSPEAEEEGDEDESDEEVTDEEARDTAPGEVAVEGEDEEEAAPPSSTPPHKKKH